MTDSIKKRPQPPSMSESRMSGTSSGQSKAVEHVRGACQSKNRRVADAARRALAYMKERL